MHAIERELIKATGYKPPRKFADREDYLKSLLNSVMKLTDADFDLLTDEAAAWTNQAVDAHNSKNGTIPDFDEVAETTDETDDGEEEADEAAIEDADDAEAEDEASEDEPTEDAPIEDSEPDGEDEPAPKPAKKKPAAKAKEKTPAKVPAKAKVAAKKPVSDDEDVVVDKWGCMEGSKNAQALAMFERGATAREVKDAIGGTYYNILTKMVKNGHKMEKDGAIIKIIHSSDRAKKKSK